MHNDYQIVGPYDGKFQVWAGNRVKLSEHDNVTQAEIAIALYQVTDETEAKTATKH